MKALKKLLDTTTKRVIAIVVVVILVTWLILFFLAGKTARGFAIECVVPLLWTLLIVTVAWLAIHFGVKAWRKRKRGEFDQAVAAKEGIEDRRREWSTWTAELEKQGIDRYELPFYLLVGEPQSGKSVLLHNSDLHFPFGQNRLSGVGGTRGCDWWFTEEAVILDLAGRLFTHEGGATDRLEFEAFLQLLYEFRPLCPANGVILVIPCDSLLKDSAELCAAKATKIQNALLTLTTKLQAQLPVYLVLTKGDQIFGFAESVHRLDVERRHQMFGWSRPAEKIDAPFDVAEVVQGFEELVRRARLLRAHMSAGARLPEALPEVDRLYAFPHELAGMQPNLEGYLKRIFTASNITDRVFFRGLYLTSGLQSGVPIAKVCTELFGQAGEADMRDLQALFSKQRAYFIKDLVQKRVFGERGLVRPTQGRVQQTRRTSVVGYGLAGLVLLSSVIWSAVYLMSGVTDERQKVCDDAIGAASRALKAAELPPQDLLHKLQQVMDAAELPPETLEKTFQDPRRESFEQLYCELFDARLLPLVHGMALSAMQKKLDEDGFRDHEDLLRQCAALSAFTGGVDFSIGATRDAVLASLEVPYASLQKTHAGGEPLTLTRSFEVRNDYGDPEGMLVPWSDAEGPRIVDLALRMVAAIERSLEPGAKTGPRGEFGYMVCWYQAEQARKELLADRLTQTGRAIAPSIAFYESMRALKDIQDVDLKSGKKPLTFHGVRLGGSGPYKRRRELVRFVGERDSSRAPAVKWLVGDATSAWSLSTLEELGEAPFRLNDLGIVLGSDDLGQTVYQQEDSFFMLVTTKLSIGEHADPLVKLDKGMLALCERSLPLSPRNGGLAGLAKRIKDLDKVLLEKEQPDSEVFTVFLAQCLESAGLFASELASPDEAVRAAGVEPGAAKALCVPLVRELAGLHGALADLVQGRSLQGTTRERLKEWQRSIERVLFEHLAGRAPAKDWVPALPVEGSFSDEAWDALEALGEASRIAAVAADKFRAVPKAQEVQRAAFFALAKELEGRWKARPADRIAETAQTVDELSLLAGQVDTRLGASAPALAEGGELAQWGGRIDQLLADRLGLTVSLVEGIWKPEPPRGSLSEALRSWHDQLHDLRAMIVRSEEAGMRDIGRIVGALRKDGSITKLLPRMPLTEGSLARLRGFGIPESEAEVTGASEYGTLVRAIEEIQKRGSGEEGFGPYLARKYAEEFSGLAAEGEGNAGIRLVREIRRELGGRLRAEIRRKYLEDLAGILSTNKYSDLFELLFWDPTQEAREEDDKEVVDDLGALLDPKGELAKLGEQYRFAGKNPEERWIGNEIFPAQPAPDEDEWASVHRFLVGLQKLLVADKTRIKDAKLDFRIEPVVETTGSVWHDKSLPAPEKRAQFYFPSDDSGDGLQTEFIRSGMGTLTVRGWNFSGRNADRRLRFLWSNKPLQDQAQKDPERYSFEVPTCLAPLLLAWSGTAENEEEPLEFLVEFVPKNSKRPAPMRLLFDQALPLRPPKP